MRDQSTPNQPGNPARLGDEVTTVWVDHQWLIERWLVGSEARQSEWAVAGSAFWDLAGQQVGEAEHSFRLAMTDRRPVEQDLGATSTGERVVGRLVPSATGAMVQIHLASPAPAIASPASVPDGLEADAGWDSHVPQWAREPLLAPGETIAASDLYPLVVQRLVGSGGFQRVALSILIADRLLVAHYAGYALIDVLRPVTEPGPGSAIVEGRSVRVVGGAGTGMLAEDSAVAIHAPYRSGSTGALAGVITVEWPDGAVVGDDDMAALTAVAEQVTSALDASTLDLAIASWDMVAAVPGAATTLPPAGDAFVTPEGEPSLAASVAGGDSGGDGGQVVANAEGAGGSGVGEERIPDRLEALVTRHWDANSGRWPLSGINARIEQLSGYTAGELWSDPGHWLAAVHPDDRSQAMRGLSLEPEVGQRSQTVYRFRRTDGAWRLFHEEAVVVLDPAGDLVNAIVISDVTEDRRTVELLYESETRYRYLVDDLPGVVAYIRDYDPRYETLRTSYISAEIESMTGISPDVWIRDNVAIISLVHPEDRERVETSRRAVIGQLTDFAHEYRIIRPDGQIRWVRNRVRHIPRLPDEDRNGERWHGVLIDITSQREAEIALAEREAAFRLLVEQLPSATLFSQQVDRSADRVTTTYLSPQVTALTGFDLDDPERPDPPFLSLVHPDDRPLVVANMPGTGTTSDRLSADFRIIHRSGRTRWMRCMVYREHDDPEADLVTWRGIVIDITDQRVAEEAARAEDVRLRTVVEQASEIVLIVENRGSVSFASPAVETMLGYGPDRIPGLTLQQVVHPDNLAELQAAFRRLRQMPGNRISPTQGPCPPCQWLVALAGSRGCQQARRAGDRWHRDYGPRCHRPGPCRGVAALPRVAVRDAGRALGGLHRSSSSQTCGSRTPAPWRRR